MNLVRIPIRKKENPDRDRCCALLTKNRTCNESTSVLFTDGKGDSFGLCNTHWEEDVKLWEIEPQPE